jgi:cytochrome c-type biogenesis protein CcmF
MMKVWNVWLMFSTFILCILGTFLTAGRVVSSVHAFAQSSIGSWFVGFLAIIFHSLSGCLPEEQDYLKSESSLMLSCHANPASCSTI